MALSKEGLLAACTATVEEITLPDSFGEGLAGQVMYLRTLSAGERDNYESSLLNGQGKATNLKNYRSRFLTLAIANDDGTRMFDDKDVAKLAQMNGRVSTYLMDKAQTLNGMDADEEAEAEKN